MINGMVCGLVCSASAHIAFDSSLTDNSGAVCVWISFNALAELSVLASALCLLVFYED